MKHNPTSRGYNKANNYEKASNGGNILNHMTGKKL